MSNELALHDALALDGNSSRVVIHDHINTARLPVESFTAEAWVRIDQPQPWGGLIGAFQDNGVDEKGWLLGFNNSQFCVAVNGLHGTDRLTYLQSPAPFETRRWYHVAGTYDGRLLKLFVDGLEVARSDEQQGKIQYPADAFFEIGAYHDKDENFRTKGQIHEVSLYGRALADEEIRQRARAKQLVAIPYRNLALGPWLVFTDPSTAEVQWATEQPSPTRLRYGRDGAMRNAGDADLKIDHKVTLTDLPRDQLLHYVITHLHDGKQVETKAFECDTFFNYSLPAVGDWKEGQPAESIRERRFQQAARFALNTTGIDRGICLMFGTGDGRLAYHLARSSHLRVMCLETDGKIVQQLRNELQHAGTYGSRISLLQIPAWDRVPLPDQIANLIVLGGAQKSDASGSKVKEIFRLLRPYGGTARAGALGKIRSDLAVAGIPSVCVELRATAGVARAPAGICCRNYRQ